MTGLDTSDELLARCAAELSAEPPRVRDRVRLIHGLDEAGRRSRCRDVAALLHLVYARAARASSS